MFISLFSRIEYYYHCKFMFAPQCEYIVIHIWKPSVAISHTMHIKFYAKQQMVQPFHSTLASHLCTFYCLLYHRNCWRSIFLHLAYQLFYFRVNLSRALRMSSGPMYTRIADLENTDLLRRILRNLLWTLSMI